MPVYPEALKGLSAEQLKASKDAQLLRAVALLRVKENLHSASRAAEPAATQAGARPGPVNR